MTKIISERINDAFQEGDNERLVKYLEWVRSTMLDYAANIRRISIAAILLVAVFELVASSKNLAITIGSFQITKSSIVLIYLPSFIAYLYLQTIWDTARSSDLEDAFRAGFKIWPEKAGDNSLEGLISPAQPMFYNVLGGTMKPSYRRSLDKAYDRIGSLFVIGFVISIFIFEGQAYYVLFPQHSGSGDRLEHQPTYYHLLHLCRSNQYSFLSSRIWMLA